MFSLSRLLPFDNLELVDVQIAEHRLTVTVVSTVTAAHCPDCRTRSVRIHSRYTRTVADLPWSSYVLRLQLRTYRFFCDHAACGRQTFAHRFGPALPAYARRTQRLTTRLRTIAFATTAQGGARLAHQLAMPISPRTLLRLMHATPPAPRPAPQAVGIDDWAWKKGRTYGTICVDLDRHQPLDLLPERAPEPVVAWLQTQPAIAVVARDRGSTYIDAATRGAPQALQVADRFHLLQNLGDVLASFFGDHQPTLKQVADELAVAAVQPAGGGQPVPTLDGITKNPRDDAAGQRRHARMVALHEQIHALHAKRVAVATIARQLGVGRETVYRYLRRTAPPERTRARVGRRHVLAPYTGYVVQRWNEGCRNARQIWRELQAQGYAHSSRPVAWFMAELRKETGSGRGYGSAPAAVDYKVDSERKRPLTPRQAAHLVLQRAEKRTAWQAAYHERLCAAEPAIARTITLATAFTELVRQRQGAHLEAWLVQAETSQVRALCSFAASYGRIMRPCKRASV